MTELIDISKEMTPKFFKEAKKGMVLVFKDDLGKETQLKIVRLNRRLRVCKCELVQLYTEDEINAMDRHEAETIIQGKNDE
jgi:hypothetical protein